MCFILLHSSNFVKNHQWRCGILDPWACKDDSHYFAGLIRAEVPIILQWICQSSADVPENKASRTGCASSNTFPSFPQNCFDLKLSFCRGEVILYFLMKSRWVTLKKKGRKEKAEDSQRIEWAKCCGKFKTTQQFKPLRNAHCIFTAKYLLCQHLQWKLSFKEDLFWFCFPLVNRTFMLILVFYRDEPKKPTLAVCLSKVSRIIRTMPINSCCKKIWWGNTNKSRKKFAVKHAGFILL